MIIFFQESMDGFNIYHVRATNCGDHVHVYSQSHYVSSFLAHASSGQRFCDWVHISCQSSLSRFKTIIGVLIFIRFKIIYLNPVVCF